MRILSDITLLAVLRRARFGLAFIALCFGFIGVETVQAQNALNPRPIAQPYGVARSLFPVSRPRSLTQPRRAQRLSFYERQGTRTRRVRQAGAPFGPFGGMDARMARFRSGSLMYPRALGMPGGMPGQEQRQAFRQYGGFGPRPTIQPQPGDVSEALRRRHGLVQATAQTAPVARANLAYASVAGLRGSHDRAMLRPADMTLYDPVDLPEAPAPTLTDELVRNVDSSIELKRRQAWSYFREGEYRKAARTLESIAVLDRDDMESRLGEMFAYVSHGSTRKAIALLGELARREPDPFSLNVNMAERYGRRDEVLRLTLQARAQASAGRESAPLVALSTLIFWYAGDRDEARSTAAGLRTIGRGTLFESWPDKLEAARAARQGG